MEWPWGSDGVKRYNLNTIRRRLGGAVGIEYLSIPIFSSIVTGVIFFYRFLSFTNLNTQLSF